MLVLHQTADGGKADVGPVTIPNNRGLAAELARRGYVVLAPDYPSFGEYQFDFPAEFQSGRYVSGTMKGSRLPAISRPTPMRSGRRAPI